MMMMIIIITIIVIIMIIIIVTIKNYPKQSERLYRNNVAIFTHYCAMHQKGQTHLK